VETWLYAILINQHRRRIRTKERRQRRLRRWGEWVWQSPQPAAECEMEFDEWRQSIWGQVAELPEAQRHAMVLRYSEELSYEEIAQVLECPLGTVKSRLHHALAALRSKLGDADQRGASGNGAPKSATKRFVNDIRHE
jgi:RNA polymerase sigma-70 factor (ECF subfamily)